MGEDAKAQLVRDMCSISTAFASCVHRRRRSPQRPTTFVDWYLILRVDEDAGVEVIKRRYRQLALQLHPDKNKHPKSEVAFKLVSEAYECLTDKARRRAFNSERRNSFCKECYRKLLSNSHKNHGETSGKQRGSNTTEQAKPYRMLHALKETQNKLREECRVIESCLRTNKASRRDFPLFDPSDCLLFPDYPHHRSRVHEKPQDYWQFHTRCARSRGGQSGVSCESPIYEIKSESRRSRTKNSPFSS